MKKILTVLFSAALVACSHGVEDGHVKGNPDNVKPSPATGDDNLVDTRLFDIIDLDYAGLEDVKECHGQGNGYGAAEALLKYYRNRGEVDNIFVDLLAPSVTAAQISMADQASKEGGYRFYVRNFPENETGAGGNPLHWSFAAADGTINWNFAPEGMGDQEWYSQKHRLQWMLTQAKVYRTTGDEKYVKAWIEVFGDWLKTYPCPEGKVDASSVQWYDLQPAERLIDMLSIFEYCKQSPNFTPGWLSTFLCSVHDHARNVMENPYGIESSNHRMAQYQALAMAGILMPELSDAGTWLKYGTDGISSSLKVQFNEDGVHNELDPSYHTGVLAEFIDTYLLAKANGKLGMFPQDYMDNLHNAARFVMDIVYPDYTIDNYNDTRSGSSFTKRVTLRNLKTYSQMFPDDDALRYAATEGAGGMVPSTDPILYTASGYYMFRSGWTPSSMMLVLKNNFNPDNKWHCQPDNGTVCLWNKGRRFLPDAGVFSYGGSPEANALRNAYRSTNMHNTMMRGTASIADGYMLGKFLGWGKQAEYEYVVTSNDSYPDLSHRRAVFFVDKRFFVIVDEGYGSGSGFTANISWNLCATKDDVVIDESLPGGSYGAHTVFADENNMLFRTFTETSGGFVAVNNTNYYSDVINARIRRRYYRVGIDKQAGLAARFITVILPFGSTAEFDSIHVSASFTDNDGGTPGTFHESGTSVRVTVGDKNHDLSYKL